jgi:hypothetical protein
MVRLLDGSIGLLTLRYVASYQRECATAVMCGAPTCTRLSVQYFASHTECLSILQVPFAVLLNRSQITLEEDTARNSVGDWQRFSTRCFTFWWNYEYYKLRFNLDELYSLIRTVNYYPIFHISKWKLCVIYACPRAIYISQKYST